jgi:hypothetical protein
MMPITMIQAAEKAIPPVDHPAHFAEASGGSPRGEPDVEGRAEEAAYEDIKQIVA